MIRKIIKIDEAKCNGCGACAIACHEGAIEMIDGKAKLTRENYCDGLGDCLPVCPMDAITFEEREAPAYDEAAVLAEKAKKEAQSAHHSFGCPGMAAKSIARTEPNQEVPTFMESQLRQWPVQIKLVSAQAPYFDGADVLIAADCTAYAYANFHQTFIKDRITLVGCPKLDMVDYRDKLTQIFALNDIKSVTVTRMEVPCCSGMEMAVKDAISASGKDIPCRIVTISIDGKIRN
ncbi:MAG: 4Fe-4S binding protein [Selenomonadales bacterium]|nr:4Fe-4S binding protein [Selenomonadales bacterium]MBQ5860482.1 4Fe-4S binding protein [Selenomonadales bacterium]